MKDVFWTMTFFCFGIWMILHSAKAVRTGIFHGWYNHTYKDYYIHRNESPFHFWFDTLFFALMGSCFIGFSALMSELNFHLYSELVSFIHS